MKFRTIGPLNYVAMYCLSFGGFKTLFRYIDVKYKESFIERYTSHLKTNVFSVLYAYLDCIRLLRNRCAHGNHIVTLKFKNDLNPYKYLVSNNSYSPMPGTFLTVFEAIIIFLIKQLNCGKEFKSRIKRLVYNQENNRLITAYATKLSLSSDFASKLIDF